MEPREYRIALFDLGLLVWFGLIVGLGLCVQYYFAANYRRELNAAILNTLDNGQLTLIKTPISLLPWSLLGYCFNIPLFSTHVLGRNEIIGDYHGRKVRLKWFRECMSIIFQIQGPLNNNRQFQLDRQNLPDAVDTLPPAIAKEASHMFEHFVNRINLSDGVLTLDTFRFIGKCSVKHI